MFLISVSCHVQGWQESYALSPSEATLLGDIPGAIIGGSVLRSLEYSRNLHGMFMCRFP